jgi:hypothetical protein
MAPADATRPDPTSGTVEESGEDYSYDLAHEVPQATPPEAPDPKPRQPGGTERSVDPDGDYSYDLAHEVPRQGG